MTITIKDKEVQLTCDSKDFVWSHMIASGKDVIIKELESRLPAGKIEAIIIWRPLTP